MKSLPTLLLFTLIFAVSFSLQAQDVLDKVSDETCNCINKKKGTKKMDSEQLTMMLGLCMMEASGKHQKELEKKMGIKISSAKDFEALGEKIGERMALQCDGFMELIFQMMGDEDSDIGQGIKEDIREEMTENINSKSGNAEVLNIEAGNVLILNTKMDGKAVDVYCLGNFEGAELLEDYNALRKKKVTLTTVQSTIYSPKLGSFIEVAELRSIELAN